jgi:hypothetical protein
LGLGVILVLATIALRAEGRRWWCRCGQWFLWSGNIHSSHNSQHLVDPYSFSHLLHGIIFYAMLRPLANRLRPSTRFLAAVAMEAIWKFIENSTFMIDRYRKATVALGYTGDSIVNSLGDIACSALGYYLAARLPWRWSIAIVVLVEFLMLMIYRDNLTLNVLMLLWPIDAVKTWQAGG